MSQRSDRRARVLAEFEGITLGDPRRGARARTMAGRIAFKPDASLPVAMSDDARLEGAYRHLSSRKVSLDALLRPHVSRSAERVRQAGYAYAISDTSSFTFGGERKRRGLGHVNSKLDQGFRAHVTLAVSADGSREPLGLLAVGTRARTNEDAEGHSEAARWATGMQLAEANVGRGHLIHLGDRETDMFPLLDQAKREGWRFIFRSGYERMLVTELKGEQARLSSMARTHSAQATVEVPLSRRSKDRPLDSLRAYPARKGRKAVLHMTSFTARLRRPALSPKSASTELEVNVVRVWEPDPPTGEPPVEWLLFTSEPVSGADAILAVVDGYRTRWLVEEYFCALKTGCAFESKQLESAHALYNMFAYCLVVAYVLLLMRALARSKKKSAASEVLTDVQLICLRALSEGKLDKNPSAQSALLQVAALGGHLKNNGDPGWRTLSRGWSRLLDAEEMYLLLQAAQRSDQ